MKIKTKIDQGKLKVKVVVSFLNYVNSKELSILKDNYLIQFLRPEHHNLFCIEYSGTMGMALSEYMSKPLSKKELNHLLMQIVLATESLINYQLPLQHLVLDTSNIYINNIDKKIQLLYVPTSNNKSTFSIMSFLCSLVYDAIPKTSQDSDYFEQLINYLKALKNYDAGVIKSYLLKEDKTLIEMMKRHQIAQKGLNVQSIMFQEEDDITEQSKNQDIASNDKDEDETVLDDNDGTVIQFHNQIDMMEEAALDELTVDMRSVIQEDDFDNTIDLSQYQIIQEDNNYPKLTRLATNEEIKINKAVFRIGKSSDCVDYAIKDNKSISRIHADIIQRENNYFIVDQGSKNHTYVNDNCIQQRWEAQINDGDHIKLSNEEFIFHRS